MTAVMDNKLRRGIKKGLTNIYTHDCCYEWRIKGISSYVKDFDCKEADAPTRKRSLYSPEFSTGSCIGDKWKLKFQFDSIFLDHCVIKLVDVGEFDTSVKLKCSFVIYENHYERVVHGNCEFNKSFDLRSFNDFQILFPRAELLNGKNFITPNDTLTVGVELTLFEVKSSDYSVEFGLKHQDIIDDFESLYLKKQDPDADIVVKVQDKIFKAHRTILIARCPDFLTLFTTEKDENDKDCVVIPDMEPDVFKTILQFIYTDGFNYLEDNVEDLFVNANKLKLHKLREACQQSFYQILSCKNATRLLVIAIDYNLVELEDYISDFIVRNADQVIETPEYKAIVESNPSLGVILLKKLVTLNVTSNSKNDE